MPVELVQAQERAYYLAVIQTLRTVETRKTLLEHCEGLRAAFAPESEVRYAWANVGPELLRELWAVMEKIGGIVPPRPQALMDKPSVSEPYIQEVLDAINTIMAWCEAKDPDAAKSETPAAEPEWTPPDSPQRWAKLFGFSVDTLKRRIEEGVIRAKKLSTKKYQIAVDDLPAMHQAKFRTAEKPPPK
jgi:hypothetical protein